MKDATNATNATEPKINICSIICWLIYVPLVFGYIIGFIFWGVQLGKSFHVTCLNVDNINDYGLNEEFCNTRELNGTKFLFFNENGLSFTGHCKDTSCLVTDCIDQINVNVLNAGIIPFLNCFDKNTVEWLNITKVNQYTGYNDPNDGGNLVAFILPLIFGFVIFIFPFLLLSFIFVCSMTLSRNEKNKHANNDIEKSVEKQIDKNDKSLNEPQEEMKTIASNESQSDDNDDSNSQDSNKLTHQEVVDQLKQHYDDELEKQKRFFKNELKKQKKEMTKIMYQPGSIGYAASEQHFNNKVNPPVVDEHDDSDSEN